MKPVVFVVALVVPGLCFAQTPATDATGPATRSLEVNGHKGTWFPSAAAKRLLKDIKQCEAEGIVHQYTQQRLELEKSRTQLLELQTKDLQKISDIWRDTAERQTRAALKAHATPWWKSPYLWLAVGFAAGAGVTVGITYAVSRSGAVN